MSKTIRLLVVEDSLDDYDLLIRHFRAAKFPVAPQRVDTRDDLVKVLANQEWDVIISDFAIGSLSGLEALKIVRAGNVDIPFIMVSGSIGEEIAVQAMKDGATDYIMKDNIQRLIPVIERELKESMLRREKKNVEISLLDSEARFMSLCDNALVGIFSMNPIGELTYANAAAVEICGHSLAELNSIGLTRLVHEEDLPQVVEAIQELRKQAIPVHVKIRLRHPGGNVRHVELQARSVKMQKDGLEYFVGTIVDLTEQFNVEYQLVLKARELSHSQKMDALGRLAGGIAHDFNNILAVMFINLDSVLTSKTPVDPVLLRRLREVFSASERAASLVKQLLTFSKKGDSNAEFCDPGKVALSMFPMLERIIGDNITLKPSFTAVAAKIACGQSPFEQVLLNLVVNAKDAMPDGGVIQIQTRRDEIPTGHQFVLEVTDSGSGMDEQTAARIFEPFFTTKGHGKGTGLGLSTVYGVVKGAGGKIDVTSELGKGTKFTVQLPIRNEDSTHVPEPAAGEPTELTREFIGSRIVLVEDDEAIGKALSSSLGEIGFQVRYFPNAKEAIAQLDCSTLPLDILITDFMMPHLSGLELIEALGKRHGLKHAILMSGYKKDLEVPEFIGPTKILFLQKPFSMGQLLAQLKALLGAGQKKTA
ncbi:MAG: response regulator [Bacteriovoracia bacterium]